jgi:hypothetical protein
MTDKIVLNELVALQNDCAIVSKIIGSHRNVRTCTKKIEKFHLAERIGKIEKYGLEVMMIAPALVELLERDMVKHFPDLVSSIAIEVGKLHMDGLVTRYGFTHAVKGTQIKDDEIPRELERQGYLKDNYILPSFRPFDPNFTFDLDERYVPIKDKIKDVLIQTSKDIRCSLALIRLVREDACVSVQGDIIYALSELGHPASIPVLLEFAGSGNRDAVIAVIKIAYRDVYELSELAVRGVTKDLWGEDLREKVLSPLNDIVPLLLDAVQSDDYAIDERRMIADLYSRMDRRVQSEIGIFVKVLPDLLDERIGSCPVSRVISLGGRASCLLLLEVLREEDLSAALRKRAIEILGLLGHDAKEAVPWLNKASEKYEGNSGLIRETIKRIEQSELLQSPEDEGPSEQRPYERNEGSVLGEKESSGSGDEIEDDIPMLESADDIGAMIEVNEAEQQDVQSNTEEAQIPVSDIDSLISNLDRHEVALEIPDNETDGETLEAKTDSAPIAVEYLETTLQGIDSLEAEPEEPAVLETESLASDSSDEIETLETVPSEEEAIEAEPQGLVSPDTVPLESEAPETMSLETDSQEPANFEADYVETEIEKTIPRELEYLETSTQADSLGAEAEEPVILETESLAGESSETLEIETLDSASSEEEALEAEPQEHAPLDTESLESEAPETMSLETDSQEPANFEADYVETEIEKTIPLEAEYLETSTQADSLEPEAEEPVILEAVSLDSEASEPLEIETLDTASLVEEAVKAEPIETVSQEAATIETDSHKSKPFEVMEIELLEIGSHDAGPSETGEPEPSKAESHQAEAEETEALESASIETAEYVEPTGSLEIEDKEEKVLEPEPDEPENLETEPEDGTPYEVEYLQTVSPEDKPALVESLETESPDVVPLEAERLQVVSSADELLEAELLEEESAEAEPLEIEAVEPEFSHAEENPNGVIVKSEPIPFEEEIEEFDLQEEEPETLDIAETELEPNVEMEPSSSVRTSEKMVHFSQAVETESVDLSEFGISDTDQGAEPIEKDTPTEETVPVQNDTTAEIAAEDGRKEEENGALLQAEEEKKIESLAAKDVEAMSDKAGKENKQGVDLSEKKIENSDQPGVLPDDFVLF